MNDTIQILVNLLLPLTMAWAGWLTKQVAESSKVADRAWSSVETIHKDVDRLSAEIISHRNGHSEVVQAIARLSAQQEMLISLLETLRMEIKDGK